MATKLSRKKDAVTVRNADKILAMITKENYKAARAAQKMGKSVVNKELLEAIKLVYTRYGMAGVQPENKENAAPLAITNDLAQALKNNIPKEDKK